MPMFLALFSVCLAGVAITTSHVARNAIAVALLVLKVQEGEEAALAAEDLEAETGVPLRAVRGTGTARRWNWHWHSPCLSCSSVHQKLVYFIKAMNLSASLIISSP